MRGIAKLGLLVGLTVGAASAAFGQHEGHGAAPAAATAAIADPYERGLYLLHNFEYDYAADAFRQAQKADPANVMAYWGEAMTHNHPLWAEQDLAAARAVLQRLAPDAAGRSAKARNAREAQWLAAIETLYGEGSKVERDRAYHRQMQALFDADPRDVDARAFLALATLGLAHGGRDTALYMRSAALLEEAFPQHPDHPGLLHYMIHSYDDPAHAPLGERAAARYARVAPDAGHAQHMISHIYLALGRWPEVERANLTADQVVDAQRAAQGRGPANCGHYNEWLVYALQQQGKDSASMIDACRADAQAALAGATDTSVIGTARNLFNNWAVMAVRQGVDTGRWPPQVAMPEGNTAIAGRFTLAYGRLLAARRDPAAAAAALADLKRYRALILEAMAREAPDDYQSAAWLDRAVAQGEAVVALARGEASALALLKAAAEAEAALPPPFGPPVLAKPSYELLGDEYLALGRKEDAAVAYRQTLAAAPGRRLAMLGLAAAEAR